MEDPATGGQRQRRYRTFLDGGAIWEKRKGYDLYECSCPKNKEWLVTLKIK